MSPTSANDDGDIEMADVNRDTTEGDLRAIQEESQHRLEGTTNYNEERLLYIGNMPPTVQRPDFAKLLYPEGYIDTTY
ncbi:hypothetical protein NW766_001987 [Fusarium irregulare]|uniref:Uncharacterized protein n=1 Tax=Fusarium irregulare TaxID=2494466 RepID=A0A9W8PWT7_9HYPO|nr:hypothetical protein NW766_001987 [Fusarium irregulare]